MQSSSSPGLRCDPSGTCGHKGEAVQLRQAWMLGRLFVRTASMQAWANKRREQADDFILTRMVLGMIMP
ncbi:hypothetical protein WJX77_001685 [Trebouxia sp. C0004]